MFRTLLDLSLYRGKAVDNGHCVRFAQIVTPSLPHTSQWRAGRSARGSDVPAGTIIATFGANGRYENKTDGSSHAAIFVEERADGLWVWDQWVGHPVAERLIRFRGGAGSAVNDGDRFRVVEIEPPAIVAEPVYNRRTLAGKEVASGDPELSH